ncbi:uncharacterized protein LOC131478873 [Ochotona princeps]|uniref:uncharacterized protein LOC131478873 n=1 Tax=Ochotona princeps TaxID=9978 RepID=UPI0027152D7A|nr:uncharacterized protein LOC131478873 [Ochotona princeps]
MPIDVNLLREEKGGDLEVVRRSEKNRGRDPAVVDAAVAADKCWRECLFKLEQLKRQLNSVNKALGEEKKNGAKGPAGGSREAELLQEALHIRDVQLPSAAAAAAAAERQRESLLHRIGNILCASVPVALCETKNAVLRTWGYPLPSAVNAVPSSLAAEGDGSPAKGGLLHHHQILARLGGVELKKGVEVAGHRGYYLKGPGFLLNMALAQHGINFLLRRGYTPVQPPFFMRRDVMARAAELKDFEETLYRIPHDSAAAGVHESTSRTSDGGAGGGAQDHQQQQEDRDDMFLIATSEQPLCALHRGQVLEEKQLPIRYAGYSSCFRKEAGAHGKDCWGIFRVHQFEKVEQFCLCAPEQSWRMHDEMLSVAEEFYQSLELPYRVVSIVSGALNDAAAKKYDLEAWFPAYGEYRELVSCSNCTDYQSRALDIRMQRQQKAAMKSGGAAPKQLPQDPKPFVHMLNGTLVATQRCMCCILENYQTATGVKVPRALQPYMGGVDFLPYVQAADDPAEKKQQHKREA